MTALRKYAPYLTLFVLFMATSLALVYLVDVKVDAKPGVRLDLPDRIGEWTGQDIYYCHNEKCLKVFVSAQLAGLEKCPSCAENLRKTWSLGETRMLPKDTILIKKRYILSPGNSVTVSVVVSGSESVSIHRPQICLAGQGLDIAAEKTMDVNLSGKRQLKVMVLDLLQRRRLTNGQLAENAGYYAYWFNGNKRETPYHSARMFYTAVDRLFEGRNPRWSYITVSGGRIKGSDSYREEIGRFVEKLYPYLVAE
jgi:hypothetical protein